MILKLRWSLSVGIIFAIAVFFSSFTVNSLYTSMYRSIVALIIGLLFGFVLYIIWTFVLMDFKTEQHTSSEESEQEEANG